MDVRTQLIEKIRNLALNHLSTAEFEDWFFPTLWDAEESGGVVPLAGFHKIEGILAEASHAHWSAESLRRALAAAIRAFDFACKPPAIAPNSYTAFASPQDWKIRLPDQGLTLAESQYLASPVALLEQLAFRS